MATINQKRQAAKLTAELMRSSFLRGCAILAGITDPTVRALVIAHCPSMAGYDAQGRWLGKTGH